MTDELAVDIEGLVLLSECDQKDEKDEFVGRKSRIKEAG